MMSRNGQLETSTVFTTSRMRMQRVTTRTIEWEEDTQRGLQWRAVHRHQAQAQARLPCRLQLLRQRRQQPRRHYHHRQELFTSLPRSVLVLRRNTLRRSKLRQARDTNRVAWGRAEGLCTV